MQREDGSGCLVRATLPKNAGPGRRAVSEEVVVSKQTSRKSYRVAIIGSGFSGLCLAIHLKKEGLHRFTIFEKGDRIGGTWRDNSYPGAACDVPSFAYCFSFEQKTDWSRKWSLQPEILEYMEHCARKYDLLPHLRLHTEVVEAAFNADAGLWRLQTATGEQHEAEILISGVGQLSLPKMPNIPGRETFAGDSFHSARWNHDVDLDGKDVAVVGNAASAIQFVPQVAPQVRNLVIFQRSANWMVPRNDRAYSPDEKKRYRRFPWLAKLYRWSIWLRYEMTFFPIMRHQRWLSERLETLSLQSMRAQISDPGLREVLVPDYPIGARRMLISDDYYAALTRPNVHVVTDAIDHVQADGIVTKDRSLYQVNAIIYATGFQSTSFLAPMQIRGANGQLLQDVWKNGAFAYLGMAVPGFPNFFMMYGPNTNLGHNSIIFMIECQTAYIMDCLRQMSAAGLQSIDVRSDVVDAHNQQLQKDLAGSVWAETDHSWYKTADGKITNNWSGLTATYWWRTRRAKLRLYHQESASRPAPSRVSQAA